MARVTLVPGFVQEVHGSLGKNSDLIFRTVNGQISMYKKPERKVKSTAKSPSQVAQRERFRLANEAIKIMQANATLKRWAEQQWKSRGGQHYVTLRGWLMAELTKK